VSQRVEDFKRLLFGHRKVIIIIIIIIIGIAMLCKLLGEIATLKAGERLDNLYSGSRKWTSKFAALETW
jgi:hypothetical protein